MRQFQFGIVTVFTVPGYEFVLTAAAGAPDNYTSMAALQAWLATNLYHQDE